MWLGYFCGLVYFSILIIPRAVCPQRSYMMTKNEADCFYGALTSSYERKTSSYKFLLNQVCKPATSERLVGKFLQI